MAWSSLHSHPLYACTTANANISMYQYLSISIYLSIYLSIYTYIYTRKVPVLPTETIKLLIMANISERLSLSLFCPLSLRPHSFSLYPLSLSFAPLALPLSPSFAPPPLSLSLSLSLCGLSFSFSLPTGLIFIVSGATSRGGTVGLCASGQLYGTKDQHQKHLLLIFFINLFTITNM